MTYMQCAALAQDMVLELGRRQQQLSPDLQQLVVERRQQVQE